MSEEGDAGAEKEFEASQKKLDEARRKGEVPRSADLMTAAGYGALLLALAAVGASAVRDAGTALMAPLVRAPDMAAEAFSGGAAPLWGGMALALGAALAPVLLLPGLGAILAAVAQRGLVFAPDKLAPRLSRVSPLSTAKQKFGPSGLFEFLKSFLKLATYSLALGLYLSAELPRIVGTMRLSSGQIAAELGRMTVGLLALVLLISVAIGLLDFVFQRSEHMRKHRMTRKEMTDEMKESDGDPAMKQERRQKAMDLAGTRMLDEVAQASVVIVNPTHYAVALRWSPESPGAPVCVAKGVDHVALRIRARAQEGGVPVRSDPATARALHATVELGAEIMPEHYRAVAAAIRFADAVRKKARRRP